MQAPAPHSRPGFGGSGPSPAGTLSICSGDLRPDAFPFRLKRADDDRLDQHHDLVPVGVMCAELAALIRVKATLEQRPENRRVDLAPVQAGGFQHQFDILPVEG